MTSRQCGRRSGWLTAWIAVAIVVGAAASGCTVPDGDDLHGQVSVTFLHTSDIHSRLFPYDLELNHFDGQLGLGEVDSIVSVGGAARVSHVIGRERARASRSLYLDTGDPFQGAPVFNYFDGEPEMRTLSNMGLDVMVVGNHEFDKGILNLATQVQRWTNFPCIVANYWFEDSTQPGASPLGSLVQPYSLFDLDGLKLAVIGMGTLSSITSIYDMPNKLGITPLHTVEVVQFYIDLLRPLVDVVVVASHLGLHWDQEMIAHTSGIDLVVGGHNHIALQPPKRVKDCARVDEQGRNFIELNSPDPQDPEEPSKKVRRYCSSRDVVLSHPGAFAKFVGRLDLVFSDDPTDFEADYLYSETDGFEILSVDYTLFPINAEVPEDPTISRLLEPYGRGLDVLDNLDLLIAYSPEGSMRNATNGGDSPLGNMIAQAMWLRLGVQTDFSLTNTTGIRADVVPGPVSIEQMFNIFPFDNSVSKMQLSGIEVKELFDFITRRSAGRGCKSQAQIAGARVVLDCQSQPDPTFPPGEALEIYIGPVVPEMPCGSDADCCRPEAGCTTPPIGSCDPNTARCWQPIDPIASYEMATSNYLAGGGSGYRMLQRNTTQSDTKIQQRDALIDFLRGGKPCGSKEDGSLWSCRANSDCVAALGPEYVCACPATAVEGEQCSTNPNGACPVSGEDMEPGDGACVLARCRDDVAAFEKSVCAGAPTADIRQKCETSIGPCARGGEMCKFLACMDTTLGNNADGRIKMVGK